VAGATGGLRTLVFAVIATDAAEHSLSDMFVITI
jgi:hypothetical protein